MKPLFSILSAILTGLLPCTTSAAPETAVATERKAAASFAELAATKRAAALIMIEHESVTDKRTGRKFAKASSRGVFISKDGLALVSLMGVCLPREPQVATADKTQLKFGTVLGMFPAEGLALMKFDHRPKVWLKLAEKEPEVGESIALIPMNLEPSFGKVPVVVGPVMAKYLSRTSKLRVPQFKRILSLGAGLSGAQSAALEPGVFAIDRAGHLVAFVDIVAPAKEQTLIYLDSVPLLFSRIEKLAAGGKAIPFPLAEADLPLDPVHFDEEFYQVFANNGGKAPAVNMPLLRGLMKRYPESGTLKNRILGAMIANDNGEPLVTLEDYPLPDPGMPTAAQVDRLLNRNTIPWKTAERIKAGIEELKRAVELSPVDFPTPRVNLAYVQDSMGNLEEADALYREAFRVTPEDMDLIQRFERFLNKRGKYAEADKLSERFYEVAEIYRR